MNSGLVALAILSAHLIINSAAQVEELAKRTKEPRKVFIVARQLNIDGQTYIRTIDFFWMTRESSPLCLREINYLGLRGQE